MPNLYRYLPAFIFLSISTNTFAMEITHCSNDEVKQVVTMLVKDKLIDDYSTPSYVEPDPKGYYDGGWFDQSQERFEFYKGDFSNEGIVEYAVVTTGGTMHVNTVTVYKYLKGHLVDAHLDYAILGAFMPGDDMSRFYNFVTMPFGYVSNGKTYIQFSDTHLEEEKEFISTLTCTYLWEGEKIKLVRTDANPEETDPIYKYCIGDSQLKVHG